MNTTTESPSPAILVALVLGTIGCLATLPQLRRVSRGEALGYLGLGAWVMSIAMAISVYATGKPNFLVPPHLRND